jgi:diguanylate cyclase (GGDEF)-like protein
MTDITKTLLPSLTLDSGLVITCNDAFTKLLGFSESEIKNTLLEDKLIWFENTPFIDLKGLQADSIINEEGSFSLAKIFNNLHYAVSVKLHCVSERDNIFKLYFCIIENKSVDPIAELPNGWGLTSRINYLIDYQDLSLKNMALIILDVDNFSTVNYRYNYFVGDQYLVALGKILQEATKNIGFVVRYTNAKFGILIEENLLIEDNLNILPVNFTKQLEKICFNLCIELTKPIKIDSTIEIIKSFSIGVSSPGFDYGNYQSMQIAAETELQKSKKFSTNKFFIASPEFKDELRTRKFIIDLLPQAIAEDKIQIYYQPQYDIQNNQLIGLEALSRWNDEVLGNIPPDLFVPITEEIGLHFEFDLWVFEKVCVQIVEWQKQNIPVPRIAVNISFKTMEMSTLIERLKNILIKTDCSTDFLELEITETSSVNNAKILADNMLAAKSLGMHIAIDDFGTGYSSLSLIRTFHQSLDKLKLDRSLIEQVCNTKLDKDFTKHIIELGKILAVKVLAEGVETQQQLDLLIDIGCDYAQGYYFAKALSKEDILSLMQAK